MSEVKRYKDGSVRHRDNSSLWTSPTGTTSYCLGTWEGPDHDWVHHRENGPSFVGSEGEIEFCIEGATHREEGPASYDVESGRTQCWYEDRCVSATELHHLLGARV